MNANIEAVKDQIAKLEMTLSVLEAEEANKPKPVKNRRFANVVPGSLIEVKFAGQCGPEGAWNEELTFVGIEGEGDDAEITLNQGFDFKIYRYANHWAYGSSADKISIVRVIREGGVA